MSFVDEVIELLKKRTAALFGTDPATLSGATRFEEDLHCKSTDIVRYSAALEDEYEIEVPYMALKRCKTFEEAAQFMSDLTGLQ